MSHKLKLKNHNLTFIQKLVNLLEDQATHPYVSWTDTNHGFNITNLSGFTQNVLPSYFKHQNFSSFVRQLNMYGFSKVRSKDGDHIYQNPHLKRGSKASLKKVQRKANSLNEKQMQMLPYQQYSFDVRKTQPQLLRIKTTQAQIEKRCISLIEKNKQLMAQNQKIVSAIRKQQKRRQQLINQIIQIIKNQKSEIKQLYLQAIQSADDILRQQIERIAQPIKSQDQHFLDPKVQFLSLDDFLNIDQDDLSEGLKI